MMDTAAIDAWLAGYRRAWTSDDRGDITGLFTDDVRYFTAPYREPLIGHDAVVSYWRGEDEAVVAWGMDTQVLAREGDLYVVRAVVEYPEGTKDGEGPEEFHDLWLIRLAADGRAREFVEYFMLTE